MNAEFYEPKLAASVEAYESTNITVNENESYYADVDLRGDM